MTNKGGIFYPFNVRILLLSSMPIFTAEGLPGGLPPPASGPGVYEPLAPSPPVSSFFVPPFWFIFSKVCITCFSGNPTGSQRYSGGSPFVLFSSTHFRSSPMPLHWGSPRSPPRTASWRRPNSAAGRRKDQPRAEPRSSHSPVHTWCCLLMSYYTGERPFASFRFPPR